MGLIVVVSAGTSDLAIAEEAAVTAEVRGNRVERVYDAGVAGLHRLLAQHPLLLEANAIVVVAGMEGALASVVGGLVDRPVIAVPTSVGLRRLGGRLRRAPHDAGDVRARDRRREHRQRLRSGLPRRSHQQARRQDPVGAACPGLAARTLFRPRFLIGVVLRLEPARVPARRSGTTS